MDRESSATEVCGKDITSVEEVTDGSNAFTDATSSSANLIQDFYRGRVVLVTGATGFIGKALVEKLLRSCPDIAVVYLLMRPKRGLDVASRYRQLLMNPVYDRLKSECGAHVLDKTQPIVGNVAEPGLGLSQDDRRRLIDEVDIVFHAAATVRLDEALHEAVIQNVLGTRSVIELTRQMPKIKALIYVSTAYSNAEKRVIEEKVYPPPADPEAILRLCRDLDKNVLEGVAKSLLKTGHPNTYTFTKALAEWIVQEEAVGLPRAIVRPSIVGAAWREPEPGWIDSATSVTRIMLEVGRGVIRSIICKDECIADIIPVDIVVNTLIAVSWRTATNSSNAVPVYNCTSGEANPTTWGDYGKAVNRCAVLTPTRHVLWYPDHGRQMNRLVHAGYEILYIFTPAVIYDVMLRARGAKPKMFKMAKMASRQLKAVEIILTCEWKFYASNVKALRHDLSKSGDRDLFDFNIADMHWDSYMQVYMAGIAKYIHKDTAETMEGARRKLKRLYWANKMLQCLLILIAARVVISFATFILQCLLAPD